MEVRKLKHKDLYSLSRILKKMNLKEQFKKLFTDVTGKSEEEKAKILSELQAEIMYMFIENIGLAEAEVNQFLGDLVGLEPQEFADLSLSESMAVIEKLFSNGEFVDFFKHAAQ